MHARKPHGELMEGLEMLRGLEKLDTDDLVCWCVENDQKMKALKRDMDALKAELQIRGVQLMEDHNVKFVRYYGRTGMASVAESLTLDILNPDRLKEIVGSGVWDMKVKRTEDVKYKCNPKFEQMLKAVFTGDYTFELTLDELFEQMSIVPDEKQKTVLRKKLKGDFKKDYETLRSVLAPGDDSVSFEEELWYIYRIKNAELIRAFLPEEMLDLTLKDLRQCILVENKLSVSIDYDEEMED